MSERPTVTEADLHAHVDGEQDEAARHAVETWLASHPEDAARVAAYRRQKQALHDRFDDVLAEPPPERLTAAVSGRRPFTRTAGRRIAAMLALVLAGAAAGWVARGLHGEPEAASAGLVRQAVGAHIVFAPEVRHPVEVAAAEEAHLVGWLSKRLGHAVRAPDLSGAGFRLVGGRLLPDAGAPAAQFMYEDGGGRRVTLYVRTGADGGDTAFRFAAERGVSAFYWIDGPLAYALVGGLSRPELLSLANGVYAALQP